VVRAAHPRRDHGVAPTPGKLTGEAPAKAAREAIVVDLTDILLIAVGGTAVAVVADWLVRTWGRAGQPRPRFYDIPRCSQRSPDENTGSAPTPSAPWVPARGGRVESPRPGRLSVVRIGGATILRGDPTFYGTRSCLCALVLTLVCSRLIIYALLTGGHAMRTTKMARKLNPELDLLSGPERLTLFCVASRMDAAIAGLPTRTAELLVMKNFSRDVIRLALA
jgi:hypothetical protein